MAALDRGQLGVSQSPKFQRSAARILRNGEDPIVPIACAQRRDHRLVLLDLRSGRGFGL